MRSSIVLGTILSLISVGCGQELVAGVTATDSVPDMAGPAAPQTTTDPCIVRPLIFSGATFPGPAHPEAQDFPVLTHRFAVNPACGEKVAIGRAMIELKGTSMSHTVAVKISSEKSSATIVQERWLNGGTVVTEPKVTIRTGTQVFLTITADTIGAAGFDQQGKPYTIGADLLSFVIYRLGGQSPGQVVASNKNAPLGVSGPITIWPSNMQNFDLSD